MLTKFDKIFISAMSLAKIKKKRAGKCECYNIGLFQQICNSSQCKKPQIMSLDVNVYELRSMYSQRCNIYKF